MRKMFVLMLFVLTIVAIAGCAPAPTATPVPTAVPTKAAPPTAAALPTAVPPTTAPTAAPTAAPTVAPTTAPTAAPTVAPTTAATAAATVAPTKAATTAATSAPTTAATAASASGASPTKAAAAGAATLAPMKETPALPTGTAKSADDLLEVTPEQLKAMIEGGADIVVVDAQSAAEYALGHVKGAVNLPWDTKIKSANGLPTTKLLVVYCACSPTAKPAETDAGDVAFQLVSNFGYKKVATLQGGWLTWQKLGYPTEKAK